MGIIKEKYILIDINNREEVGRLINALSQIGNYHIAESRGGLENLIDKIKQDYVIFIQFHTLRDNVIYKGLEIHEFDERLNVAIAYKKGSARGGNPVPNQIIDMKDPEKSLKNFLLPLKKMETPIFKEIEEWFKEKEFFEAVLDSLKALLQSKKK